MMGAAEPEAVEFETAEPERVEHEHERVEDEPGAPAPQPRLLPPLELEVMKVLWSAGESSVAEVQAALNDSKRLAYTTVMTLLDRLARKGAVSRRKQGRGFRYTAVFSREAVVDLAVERLVEDFFGGSREELLAHLGGAPYESQPAVPQREPEAIDSVLL